MCHSKELEPLRQSLQSNLWRIINRKSIEGFPFMEYLIDILVNRNKKIKLMNISFLKRYRDLLKYEYADVLDYIHGNIIHGDIIKLEKFIKEHINGNITTILNDFIENYETN